MDYTKYIFPIYSTSESPLCPGKRFASSFEGNGFFVGNYFVTAGHVINQCNEPCILYDGKEVLLNRQTKLLHKDMPYDEKGRPIGHDNPENADIAIYSMNDVIINSPLFFSETFPQLGETLDNIYYNYTQAEIENYAKNHEIKDKSLCIWECKGMVHEDPNDHCGDFFEATMSPSHPYGGGSSGSPIFMGSKVYGVLHAGGSVNHPEICVFFSAARILHLLNRLLAKY